MSNKFSKSCIYLRNKMFKLIDQNDSDALEASRPLRVWLQINGVEMYDLHRLSNNAVRPSLSWFGLLSCSLWFALYSWLTVVSMLLLTEDQNEILNIYGEVFDVCQAYIIVLTIYWKCITSKSHAKFWEQLLEIDNNIRNLGITMVYNKNIKNYLYKCACAHIFIVLAHCLLLHCAFAVLQFNYALYRETYVLMRMHYVFAAQIVQQNFAKAFEIRHRCLNEVLQAVLDGGHYSDNENIILIEKVNAVAKIFSKMYTTKVRSKDTFGAVPLAITFGTIFRLILTIFYMIEVNQVNTSQYLKEYLLMVFIMAQQTLLVYFFLFILVQGFENVYIEETKTTMIVQNIINEHVDETLINAAVHFSRQLLSQKYKFTADGLFDLDRKLLLSVIGLVATYVIILMQSLKFNRDVDQIAGWTVDHQSKK